MTRELPQFLRDLIASPPRAWSGALATLGDAVATTMATTAIQTATEQGKVIGMTAAQFVGRTIA